jgi:hypothetical protein
MTTTTVTLQNGVLAVTLDSARGTLTVLDKRSGQTWSQQPVGSPLVCQSVSDGGVQSVWLHQPSGLRLQMALALDGEKPELLVSLAAAGELAAPLAFPYPFVSEAGTYLLVPLNEGISFGVDDPAITGPKRFEAYYGNDGLCMAFWGVTDGQRGHMAIIETPDDAAIRLDRSGGPLYIAPEWDAQKGQFGYTRRLRYVFLNEGGHVGICKRYRGYAEARGLLKTLAQKRQENPDVDRLVGAVNVWFFEKPSLSLPIAEEMQAAGIKQILWSHAEPPAVIAAMNDMGVITSRYDIVQDVVNPANLPFLTYGGLTAAWPQDLILDQKGDWVRGWGIETKDGLGLIPCGVLCDKQAIAYARERMTQDLADHPYLCRFMDTTTATPWRECYHPDHPMTRSESRHWKMELLRIISEDFHLVAGTETGHDAAVPYIHYFEGMLSLTHYRVDDPGRRMLHIWKDVPDRVANFQLGQRYRLPLFELVYHDCVISHWYWGDYSNKLPALWDKRDLFNLLYGTAPMFLFDFEFWREHRERFVQSYRNTCLVAREVGYAEMSDHRFLTTDRDVQQTVFSNGVVVTCNFSEQTFPMADGTLLLPMGYHVSRQNTR